MRTFSVDMWDTSDPKGTAEYMYRVIRDMTKSQYEVMDCKRLNDKIMSKNVPALIFFGSHKDISDTGEYAHMQMVASFDKEQFPDEPLKWITVIDQDCKLKMGFENIDEAAVMFFYHSEFEPLTLHASKDDLSFEHLVSWINIKWCQSSMTFGKRATAVTNMMKRNALLYLIPSVNDEPDFMAKLMGMTQAMIRKESNDMVVLMQALDQPVMDGATKVFKQLGIKDPSDLPKLYFMHAETFEVREYGDPIVEYEITPDMLIIWTRLTTLDIEIRVISQ
jgi:hypothetical protein